MHYGCAMPPSVDSERDVGSGRREQLLAAAREELATHGYERTTVSSIAGRAQVAQGTFYLYFPSKEALPGALAEQLSETLGTAARRAADDADGLDEGVERLVRGTWAGAAEFRDVLLVANRGIELASSFGEFLSLTAAWRDGIEHFLAHFQRRGEIAPDLDPITTAYVLRDLLDRSMKAKVHFGEEGYAEATSTLVLRALAAEAGPAAQAASTASDATGGRST
jgi:AcrR family transcriptional regulator